MSVTVDFTTVTNAIEGMSITGVTILDVDELMSTVGLDRQVLMPIPNGFINNVQIVADEVSRQKLTLTYDLHYRYFHCELGPTLNLANYSENVSAAAAILLAFANDAALAGATMQESPTIDNIGPVVDPAGKVYHGFDVSIHIMQFLEV